MKGLKTESYDSRKDKRAIFMMYNSKYSGLQQRQPNEIKRLVENALTKNITWYAWIIRNLEYNKRYSIDR